MCITGLTDLQAILSLYRDQAAFYNNVSHPVVLGLGVIWLYPVLRMRPSYRKDVFAIAAITALTFLTMYHVEYDLRLLLFTFPAFAPVMAEEGWTKSFTLFLTVVVVVANFHKSQTVMLEHLVPRLEPLGTLGTILWMRQLPIYALSLYILYLSLFYREWSIQHKSLKAVDDPSMPDLKVTVREQKPNPRTRSIKQKPS